MGFASTSIFEVLTGGYDEPGLETGVDIFAGGSVLSAGEGSAFVGTPGEDILAGPVLS